MKLFIKNILLITALTATPLSLWCLNQKCSASTPLPDSQTAFPLVITNESNQPITLHLDLRIDYYYTHKTNTTFLPASQTNEQPTIEPGQKITINLKLPLGLHEPYNSIKKSLRGKKGYEKTNIMVRGVIGDAHEPKRFFTINESIKCKPALHLIMQEQDNKLIFFQASSQ